MSNGMGRVAPDVRGARATTCAALGGSSAEGPGAVVMGLDQHRAQITAEWIDTATGEIGPGADRARAPRGRTPVPAAL
jgi:hypothetical protein